MKCHYYTKGTCSRSISFDIDPETHRIGSVEFIGGCNGNLKGIAAMVDGLKAEDIVSRLKGIRCNDKTTSCPDQLAIAIEESLSRIG